MLCGLMKWLGGPDEKALRVIFCPRAVVWRTLAY